jgi:hypothetical protein
MYTVLFCVLTMLVIKLFYPRFFLSSRSFISDGALLILIIFPVYILAVITVFFKVKYNITFWKAIV